MRLGYHFPASVDASDTLRSLIPSERLMGRHTSNKQYSTQKQGSSIDVYAMNNMKP
jgi:hypothetical protein